MGSMIGLVRGILGAHTMVRMIWAQMGSCTGRVRGT